MLGEFLYRLTAKEDPSALLIPFARFLTASGASASLALGSFTIPIDYHLWVCLTSWGMAPGAAQRAIRGYLVCTNAKVFPGTGVGSFGVWHDEVQTASTASGGDLNSGFLLPGNSTIDATANFDAGVAVNTANVSLYGFLIPRGNLTFA